jgi:hypothetical protein
MRGKLDTLNQGAFLNRELFAMRETAMAFSPLVAVMYFMFFPSQLALCLQWLVRLVQ